MKRPASKEAGLWFILYSLKKSYKFHPKSGENRLFEEICSSLFEEALFS